MSDTVQFLGRLFPLWGASDTTEDCGTFDHEYGPWTKRHWERRVTTNTDGNVVVKLGVEFERECRECGDTDRDWRPNQMEVEVETDWVEFEQQGSVYEDGFPVFEDVEVRRP